MSHGMQWALVIVPSIVFLLLAVGGSSCFARFCATGPAGSGETGKPGAGHIRLGGLPLFLPLGKMSIMTRLA